MSANNIRDHNTLEGKYVCNNYALLGCAPLARNGASKAPFHANGPEAPS